MIRFLFISLIFKIIICIHYEFEPIEEIFPKSSSLLYPGSSYKIYEYIPPPNSLNEEISKYIKIYSSYSIDIYIYDNYSKIEQDYSGSFIYYIDEMSYKNDDIKKLDYLISNKTYYFVLHNNGYNNYPIDYQFLILGEINNVIQLNPELSSNYNFFQTSKSPMKFNYIYEQNKIALIRLIGKIKLQIFENDKLIYNHDSNEEFKILNFTFKRDIEYIAIFEDISLSSNKKPSIYFQFFDDEEFIKPNLAQSSLLLFNDYEYFIEVDISKYQKGENIILLIFASSNELKIKYQYKEEYNCTNLINLGTLNDFHDYKINYIRIKKEKDDNYLIIYIKTNGWRGNFISINLLKYKVEEISADTDNLIINEEKVLFLDYFNFNQYNSFGIYSNQTFLFLEQIFNEGTKINFFGKEDLAIIKKEIYSFYHSKNAIIFFSKEINNIFPLNIEFKKFNFPIIHRNYSEIKTIEPCYEINQYSHLSENKEMYFYVNYGNLIDAFLPIFGKYETAFIKEKDIKNLSDFDFDKKNKSENYICGEYSGYLKIKNINDNTLFQHLTLDSYERYYKSKELDTGKQYLFLIKNLIDNQINITIKSNYVNNNIFFKFRVFGLNNDEIVTIFFDEKKYELNNNSLEIIYEYKKYNPNLIYFSDDEIKKNIFVEIKVGFLEQDLKLYKQINFKDAIGKITYDSYNGTIIKIPRDLNEDLFNYILIIKNKEANIQITYDTIEYAVPMINYNKGEMLPLIELFKSNPYMKELNDTNKLFFIIINGGNEFVIKKPKIYDATSLEFNRLNIINKLTNENEKYFYKIELPKSDYNYMKIQTMNLNNYNYISLNEGFYRKINNINYETFYSFSNKENAQSLFLNYFEMDKNNYLNIIPQKQYDFNNIDNKWNLILIKYNIEQIEQTNKIRINTTSLSYQYYPNKYYYYVFININVTNNSNLYEKVFQYISGDKKPDISQKQKIIILEDDEIKSNIVYDVDIEKDELYDTYTETKENLYFIIPVNKNNYLIEYTGYFYSYFWFSYKQDYSNIGYYVAGGTIAGFILIAVILGIVMYKRKKNKEKLERLNEEKTDDIN